MFQGMKAFSTYAHESTRSIAWYKVNGSHGPSQVVGHFLPLHGLLIEMDDFPASIGSPYLLYFGT